VDVGNGPSWGSARLQGKSRTVIIPRRPYIGVDDPSGVPWRVALAMSHRNFRGRSHLRAAKRRRAHSWWRRWPAFRAADAGDPPRRLPAAH